MQNDEYKHAELYQEVGWRIAVFVNEWMLTGYPCFLFSLT